MLTDESPLFITPKPPKIWDADQKVWFINSPMGINTIGQLVPKALEYKYSMAPKALIVSWLRPTDGLMP